MSNAPNRIAQLPKCLLGWQRAAASLLFITAAALPAASAQDAVDLILENGEIYTPHGWAEALAVKDGVIVAIGPKSSVDALRSKAAQHIDLKGATVFPGLHDSHVHPLSAGQAELGCKFPQGSPGAEVLATVKKCAESRPKGEWIIGGQWDAASLGQPPHRKLLDKVAPDHPVVLSDISLHSMWLNSKALELAGITAATPVPDGGVIERDANGEPNGVVRETVRPIVRRAIPPYSADQNAKAMAWSLSRMLSYGITSLTDATTDESGLRAYATLADRGELKQRIITCMAWGAMATSGSQFITKRNLYARERMSPTCIKMYLDGVPTEGRTAAMVEPYEHADDHDPAAAKGMLIVPQQQLNADVTRLDAHGFTMKLHAAGDGAVRAALDAIEAARKANGFNGQMHTIAHNSFIQMSDIRRARPIAATFEFSPYIWSPGPVITDIVKVVGAERMERWIPIKDALDAGAPVVVGSDWAVVPSVDPWAAIETLVTRQKSGGGGETLAPSQRITLQQAIDLFTVRAARQEHAFTRVGSLEEGMLADFIVLDRNPFKIPVTQIHQTKVKLAAINGEVVYRATE